MIVSFQHVQKYYGANEVLSDVSFEVGEGEKVGLIGRNGTGKTTVFHLLKGALAPDQGQIFIRKGTQVGLLDQVPADQEGQTVYDVLASAYKDVKQWEAEMKELEVRMADASVIADERMLGALLEKYGKLLEQFEQGGGYEMEASIQRIAAGLGVASDQYDRPFASLSGGEKTKVGLASLLLTQPDLLLLDEPTNHLDMNAIEWLETFLSSYSGTVMVVSHDRYFLDKVAGKMIEIEDGEAIVYFTNYSGYQQEKEARLLKQFADYQEQQKKIKKMQETIKQLIEWGNRANPPNPSFHRRAASMQKALDRMEKLKRPILERRAMDLQLQQEDRSGRQVLELDKVSKAYGERCLLSRASALLLYGEQVALIGPNGAGKSTLLKLLLQQTEQDEGEIRIGSRVQIGYLAQEEAPPAENKTVLQYFREELAMEEGKARGELARFLFYGADVFKRVANLSGGEWSRLRLALLMFRKPNLLLLDEPTNHLDIDSREALEEALEDFPGTLLAISHDRYFINRMARKIWNLEQGAITVHEGNYDEYREKLAAWAAVRDAPMVKQPAKEDRRSEGGQPGASSRRGANGSAEASGRKKAGASLPASPRAAHLASRRISLPGGRPPDSPEEWEREISAAESRIQALDEQLASLTWESAEEWNPLLEERAKLQQRLDELYRIWLEAEQ
ncbi:ribosomal protection-like ABC-F family protein [Paenibacillus sp. J2TS4]|uniref:ribosomal protection-like ABC-F family protein n=1 Tax=Paenibacillus sp. J2TS4 TaxID=2807194 RepID=UPI001B027B5F|nr:ABC-F type ribosomal protection protein [Paenibacillus sp. J2TS4]GIP34715.1 ABC transporter ATP-binding protein [Paenibacillus sp. J2TS4]